MCLLVQGQGFLRSSGIADLSTSYTSNVRRPLLTHVFAWLFLPQASLISRPAMSPRCDITLDLSLSSPNRLRLLSDGCRVVVMQVTAEGEAVILALQTT